MSSSTRTPMSSTTPASPRTGPTHPAWPGCIRAHWERSETARSGSACTRSPTGRRRRSTGDCSCRNHGTTRRPTTPILPPPSDGVGPAARSPIRYGIGRSGAWPWTCSTRFSANQPPTAGACPRAPSSAMPATAMPPSSAGAWPPGACPTWSRSRARPAPTRPAPCAPPYAGRGRPPTPRYRDEPTSLTGLALAAGRRALHQVTWRHGTRKNARNPTAAMRSRFLALRVRPANRDIPCNPDGSLDECWLLVEWPPGESEPTDYWLSNLPADTPLPHLVRLAKIRWRIEHDYRELKDGLGLDHFEGRSYLGWHRHVTLAALAQAFCTQLRRDPKVPAPA